MKEWRKELSERQKFLQEATNKWLSAILPLNWCRFSPFMQAGFTMVETGFTRAKNAVAINIIEEPDGLLYWYINVYI